MALQGQFHTGAFILVRVTVSEVLQSTPRSGSDLPGDLAPLLYTHRSSELVIQAAPVETQRALPTCPRGEMGREARLCSPALEMNLSKITTSLPSTLACWVGHTQLAHRVGPFSSSSVAPAFTRIQGNTNSQIFPFLTSHGQLFSPNSLQKLC